MTDQLVQVSDTAPRLPARRARRRSSINGILGGSVLLIVILAALLAPIIAPHDPHAAELRSAFLAPSSEHLLGTDSQGRDVLSRILYGSRISLLVGVGGVVLSGALGLAVGLLSGFVGGWFDRGVSHIIDALLSIPTMLIMLVVALVLGSGVWQLVVVIGLTGWVGYARIIRAEVLSIREREFVLAARMAGTPLFRILRIHVLPHVLTTFVVISALSLGTVILAESSLSFLGLGVQSPDISWGQLLEDGRQYVASSWWIATFPGLAITITVFAVVVAGDAVRDSIDVRNAK